MRHLDDAAIVSCYLDLVALLAIFPPILLVRLRKRMDLSLWIIYIMDIAIAFTCVLSFLCHVMTGWTDPGCHTAAMISRTMWEWLAFLIILLWAVYIQSKLYGGIRHIKSGRLLYFLPFVALTLILIVNPFTGVFFTYSEENRFVQGPAYQIFMAIEAAYFLVSLILVRAYDRKGERIRFLKVQPMLLPVCLCVSVQFFLTDYQADVLGFAIGAVLVYFSMAEENRVLDDESGTYNRDFLAYPINLALESKNNTHSALILKLDGDLPAGFRIIRHTLRPLGDVIRMEEKRFVLFLPTDSRSELQLLSTRVEEAVEEHNAEDPDHAVRMKVLCRVRTGEEDVITFLRETAEDQDAGDPVRGMASMISELAQIDSELKLAGDIQLSILPMNFPPFPDRTEFELYASIDPAKEVGGDFYDFFLIDHDHLALVIADVSGKGIPASLFMMVSKTLIKNQLMEGCDPATTLDRVNKQLCERNSSMMFVTVWLAVVEISTGRGIACNAGHEKPAVHRAGGGFELLKYRHCMLVGLDEEAEFENREFEMHPGDCVLVYTDGVPEATDASREMFGDDRLVECLNQYADKDPEEVISRVRDAVDQFVGSAPQFDDITMVCMKYYGSDDLL